MASVPEKQFITEFNTSIRRIRELVQERQESGNRLIGTITESIAAIDGKVRELKGISDAVAEKFTQLRGELERCKTLSARQQQDILECNHALEQLAATKQQIQRELEELKRSSQERIQTLQQQIDAQETRIQELTAQVTPLQKQIEQITLERDELRRQSEEKDRQIEGIAEKDRQIQKLTNELQTVKAQVDEQLIAIQLKDNEIEELKAQNAPNIERIKELGRSLADLTLAEEVKTRELAMLGAENDDLVSRIIEATKVINESMTILDQLRSSKREGDTRELLTKFKDTTDMIQAISNSLQGFRSGGKRYKGYKKTRKTRKVKKFRGGFTYGTSSSFRKKTKRSSKTSSSTSLFNKLKKKNKKSYRKF